MILRALFIFVLLLTAVPAVSAIEVRSGEHDGFTRVVLYLPRDAQWSSTSNGSRYRVDVEDYDDGFDIGDVFDLIPRTRLGDIETNADHIVLNLECDCVVNEELLPGGFLVLDIAEPGPIEGPEQPAVQILDIDQPVLAPGGGVDTSDPVLPVVLPRSNEQIGFPTPDELSSRQGRIEEFRRTLLEQFGRAGSQNLLDIPQTEIIVPDIQVDTPETQPEERFAEPSNVPRERLEITTAQDDALPGIKALLDDTVSGCHSPAYFAVADWRGTSEFMEERAAIQADLFGEFDRISEPAALKLVRLYLHYGLSAEAHQTLNVLNIDNDAARAARQIANLIDERPLSDAAPLRQMLDCDGSVALWSLLGADEGRLSPGSTEKIVAAFSILPSELRQIMGTRLFAKLEQFDQPVAAQIARNATDRSVTQNQMDLIAVAPSVDVATADTKELRAMLERNDEISPEALEKLMIAALENNGPIDQADIELAGGYVHQLKGSDVAARLKALELRSISRLGQFRPAFDSALVEVTRSSRPEVVNAIFNDVLELGSPGDRSLMTAALIREGVAAELDVETAQKITEDLLELGLPDLARDLNAARDEQLNAQQTQRALLQNRAYAEALAQMEEGDADLSLIANLHLLEQSPDALWRNRAADIDDEELKQLSAWRASEWGEVTGETATAALAQQIAAPQLELEAEEPLAQSGALLQKSEEARDAISQLLDRENQS